MANNQTGELRRSSVLMTYAPGAIIDMRAGGGPVSGVSSGLEEWDKSAPLWGNLKYQKIIERRLCKKLELLTYSFANYAIDIFGLNKLII